MRRVSKVQKCSRFGTHKNETPKFKLGENVEVLEAIKGRRSIRKYTKDSVPEDIVVKILDAGRWAPSAGNSQPWSFIVLKDEEVRKRVANATTYGKFLADAPLGIAVVVDPQASTHPWKMGLLQPRTCSLLRTLWVLEPVG